MCNSIVECVYKQSELFPDKLCVIDETQEFTYLEYWHFILKIRHFLLQHINMKKECILVEAEQTATYLALELAIQLCGAIFVPLEKNCAINRIKEVVETTNATMVISNHEEDYGCRSYTYKQLVESLPDSVDTSQLSFPHPQDTAEILFSTRTTGKPKGIELTHLNNIALAENVKYGVEMKLENVELIPVPLNHSHGLRRYYGNMYNGSTVVILNGVLNIKLFFYFLEKYHVTAIDLVPAALGIIFKLSGEKLADYKEQLDYIQLGSAPLPESDKIKLCEYLPNTRLYNFYGSTESGCTCILDFNKYKGLKNCIGRATCNAKFIFVDEEKTPIEATEEAPGYLACYGKMNMKGYWHDQKETDLVLKKGFIYSNDMAYRDTNGFIFMLGRKGDVINVGGNKVAPEEIESIAIKYPGISDCACIGIMDKIKGTVPKLYIVVENETEFNLQNFSQFLQLHMEPYKVPKIISYIDKIPKTFNGKIIRKKLYT